MRDRAAQDRQSPEPEGTILRILIDYLPDGVFLKDRDCRITFANQMMADLMDAADPASLIGKTDHDFYPTAIADRLLADERRVMKTARPITDREEIRRLPTGERWILSSTMPVLDANGKVRGLINILRDVTERHRAEERLQTSEQRYRELLEQAADGVFVLDADGSFLLANGEMCSMLGYTPEELREVNIFDTYPDAHRDTGRHRFEAIEAGEKMTFEREVRRKDGSIFPAELSARRLPDGRQQAILRDISERKHAEEKIESLSRFPDENPYPIMRISAGGKVIYSNKAAGAMTSSWGETEDRHIPDEYLPAIRSAWQSGESGEIEIRDSSGVYMVAIVPFAHEGYINLYGRDVTEERVLAERLNQSQKMEAIGQLTGGVAHDFNNVLQAVMGYCEVLEDRVTGESRKFVSEIMKAARRAASLTSQLLAFSRRQVLRSRIVDTRALVRSMEKMLRRLIGEDILFHTIISPDTGNFYGDPGQLEQVILNLALNARDAMPTGGNLTLETSNRTFDEAYTAMHPGAVVGRFVRIAVSDTGVGMDEETIRHIYEPFFTTKEKGKGTGLGLSTVYGIVKQSNGYINCYSEVGKGTTFTVYLPLTPAVTEDDAEAPRAERAANGAHRVRETVLLVDDDGASREVARIALEEAGYTVVEAPSGEEALAKVSKDAIRIDLLITDVVMPRMSGRTLAGELHTTFPGLRVVYLSGYTANVISHHGILEEGIDFLEKPFGARELLKLVREVLDRE